MPSGHQQAHVHSRELRHRLNFRFGFFTQTFTLFLVAGAVLWTLLLSSFLPVHDAMHPLRHLLGIIPCH